VTFIVYLLCACKFTKFYPKIKYGFKKIAEFDGDFKTIEEIAKRLGIETFGFMGKSLLICYLHIMLPFCNIFVHFTEAHLANFYCMPKVPVEK
jgi:hypothetical protein